tara:strand:+ start:152 stop:754 length:603 start_codon:yes stop_codon:yes gene_type:complete
MKSEEFIKFSDPLKLFSLWFDEAKEKDTYNYNACCLATADVRGVPSARMVLVKSFDERGFIFFTNTNSRKAEEFQRNNKVALCFYWKPLKRQVRIEGTIMDLPFKESDKYFKTRPRKSQIGAWASKQSNFMEGGYTTLLKKYKLYEEKFLGIDIPRPDFWCGKVILPEKIEFWIEKDNRLHERLLFTAQNEKWAKEYLYP